MYKSPLLLYTSNEQLKFEIKDTVALTSAPKIMKHWDINLTKMYKILYKHKTMVKEMKGSKWVDSPRSLMGRQYF